MNLLGDLTLAILRDDRSWDMQFCPSVVAPSPGITQVGLWVGQWSFLKGVVILIKKILLKRTIVLPIVLPG